MIDGSKYQNQISITNRLWKTELWHDPEMITIESAPDPDGQGVFK